MPAHSETDPARGGTQHFHQFSASTHDEGLEFTKEALDIEDLLII
jgi:hypothetical protein